MLRPCPSFFSSKRPIPDKSARFSHSTFVRIVRYWAVFVPTVLRSSPPYEDNIRATNAASKNLYRHENPEICLLQEVCPQKLINNLIVSFSHRNDSSHCPLWSGVEYHRFEKI